MKWTGPNRNNCWLIFYLLYVIYAKNETTKYVGVLDKLVQTFAIHIHKKTSPESGKRLRLESVAIVTF